MEPQGARKPINAAKVVVTDAMPRVGLLPRTPGEQALLEQSPELVQDNKVVAWRYPRLLDKANRRLYRHVRLAYRRGDAATGLTLALRLTQAEPWYMQGRIMLDNLVSISANVDTERTLRASVALGQETLQLNDRLRRNDVPEGERPRFLGGDVLTEHDHDYIEFVARYNLAETLGELGDLTGDQQQWRVAREHAAAATALSILVRKGEPDTLLLASAHVLKASLCYRLGETDARNSSLAEARRLRPNDAQLLIEQMASKNPGLQ